MREDVAEAVLSLLREGGRGALATVTRTAGSTPQHVGARLLRMPDGRLIGTVGGGALEHEIEQALARVCASGKAEHVTRELGYDLGMCCGGRMEVLVEPIEAPPRLLVCGAGHIAQATAGLAQSAGFRVSVVDEREELNTGERFPGAECVTLDALAWLKRERLSAHDWLLIATHDHQLDEQLLEAGLATAVGYIGLVGSRRKVLRILERVGARRGTLELARVYGPVGLALGALEPGEIGISIVAELVALRRGVAAEHLRVTGDARVLARIAERGRGSERERDHERDHR
ncbi:MAG TPA: XdhC/CoxI family protein [Polyangiales bacterium]